MKVDRIFVVYRARNENTKYDELTTAGEFRWAVFMIYYAFECKKIIRTKNKRSILFYNSYGDTATKYIFWKDGE